MAGLALVARMITREDMVEQSVQDYLRAQLYDVRHYDQARVELLDAFPYNRFDGALDKNYVAVGFNFDDGGTQAELGSDLRRRVYTIEFFVFGLTPVWARNLANVVKFALEHDGVIPLKNIGVNDEVIDVLVVIAVRAERIPTQDPKPWEENVWVTRLNVQDEYHAALV